MSSHSSTVKANTVNKFQLNIQTGDLLVTLAANDKQLDQAQALRYQIYFNELNGVPSEAVQQRQRDFDEFDDICDHLLVIDNSQVEPCVVGTYRLLRHELVKKTQRQFYTQSEFDITSLLNSGLSLMEVGRSCIDQRYRTRPTIQLLWRGIAQYMQHYQIDALFGCVSFIGTHIKPLAEHLAFLHHHCSAPANLAPRALAERYVDMNLVDKAMINDKQVMTSLPPLIKGYLRLGGLIGQGAVIDPVYNTTDVSVVVTKANMPPKYFRHYFPAVARQN